MNGNTPWRTLRGNRMLALSQGRNDWYRIKNKSDGPTQLHIYDEIGFLGVSAADLIRDLADISGPIDVHLNSPGGEVYDGLAIYNTLLSRPDVEVYIDGIAASIASVIAMAGKKIHIAPTAQMMIHNAFTMAVGDAKDLRAYADRLEESTQVIASIYASRTGRPAKDWLEIMDSEGWYRGQQAIDIGLADCLIEAASRVPELRASHDLTLTNTAYARGGAVTSGGNGSSTVVGAGGGVGGGGNASTTPRVTITGGSGGAGSTSNAAAHPYHSHDEPLHEPMTGTHSHNHAAFGHDDADDGIHHHPHRHNGDAAHSHTHMSHEHDHQTDTDHHHAHNGGDEHYGTGTHMHTHHAVDYDGDGDDDTSASGDTDHDYVLPDGNPGPKAKGNAVMARADLDHPTLMHVDLHNASYDDSAWDGPAAMSAAAKSKNPASALSAICAGRRAGDASTEEAHALPHHKSPGSPPNKHGVTAALGRLNQTQGLTNKSAAQAHLEAHARAWASESDGGSDSLPHDQIPDDELQQIIETLRGVH